MVSVDKPEDNKRFALEHEADFPILSDPGKGTGNAYGVMYPQGFAKRWTFYIDKEGVIQKIDQRVKPVSAGADMAAAMADLGWEKK